MVEKKYYWLDFKSEFTVKTKEGIDHEFLIGTDDADIVMSTLMHASEQYMCYSSITDDVSYFKEHLFPYIVMYHYEPSILSGNGIMQYTLEIDLINHVITIMKYKILTSTSELILKSEGIFTESTHQKYKIMIDYKKLNTIYPTNDEDDPYYMLNDLRAALFTHFMYIYNGRGYTESTLNELGLLNATKELLKSFQTYLKIVDESSTTYTHAEVMDLLVQQMHILGPKDFRDEIEGYRNFPSE